MQQTEKIALLPVGVPLYTLPSPHLHGFCLSLYVKGGSLYETEGTQGTAHFIEHLLFRSIHHHMGDTLYQTLDRLGLSVEGVTYREFLQFSISGAASHFAEAARILSYALAPLCLTAEDLRVERQRVKAEIREEGDRTSLDAFTERILFESHPLSHAILGTAGNLDRMSMRYLKKEKDALFSKENCFFYLTGNTPENAEELLDTRTKGYRLSSSPRKDNRVPLPQNAFRREGGVFVKQSPKTLVRLSFDIDTSRYTDAELTLLYDLVFGDGEQSYFHRALSENTGMIYAFRGYMELYRGYGSCGVSYEIRPCDLIPSLSLAKEALCRAKAVGEDALAYLRAPYVDNAPLLLDDASALNFNRAYERFVLGLPYPSLAARADAYRSVSPERLSLSAKEIFSLKNLTVTCKGRRIDTAKIREVFLDL